MSPLDVIPVPGYPGEYNRRRAVEAWQRAGSPRLTDAGRTKPQQRAMYDGWRSGEPGFYPADNPDAVPTQRLAHVRMIAFDIANQADIQRMIDAGFIFPYSYEWWHAELPEVWSYPLVESLPVNPPVSPIEETSNKMVLIFIEGMKGVNDAIPEKRQRVLVDAFNYQPVTEAASKVERELWGKPVNVNVAEAQGIKDRVNARRRAVGYPEL